MATFINQKQIRERSKKLESVRKQLKREFIGIDKQIDQIVNSAKAWYICPEYINRPVIINLWGITGTFKTSVIRRFITLIDFYTKTAEIDMREITSDFGCEKKLSEMKKYNGEQHIFVFDEFQNVRTIDEERKEVSANRDGLARFFSLINDGTVRYVKEEYYISHLLERAQEGYTAQKIGYKREKRSLGGPVRSEEDIIDNIARAKEMSEDDIDDIDGTEKEIRDVATFARIQALKLYQLFGLTFEQCSVMTWEKLFNTLTEMLKTMKMEEFIDHSKALIFICGNIDEAFAGLTDELDQDLLTPDEFYEESSMVNSTDIKGCLLMRFRPEQISRLGSCHTIFPSFNNKMYENLIDQLNKKSISEFKKQCGNLLILDPSIKTFLMQNSAVPSQGARPILSSHAYLINSNISEAIMLCIVKNAKKIKIEIKNLQVIISSGKEKIIKEIDIVDKRVHEPYLEPTRTLVAGHEAGHAIVAYAFTGKNAILVKTRNSDSSTGGYCKPDHISFPTKQDILNSIAISMGGIAYEILSSKDGTFSTGGSSDIAAATYKATSLQRVYGMGNHIGNSSLTQTQSTLSYNKKEDEMAAESLVEEALLLALTALIFYKKEHALLTEALRHKTIMRADEIAKVTGLK